MKYLLLSLLLLCVIPSTAQEDDRALTVSGTVHDAELKEPVIQASVQLFRQRDSTFVGGTVTDLHGNFSVEAPSNGIYRLKISSIGFQPIQREVTLRRNQSQDLGDLLMSSDAVLLKETVVTGRAAQVVVKNQPCKMAMVGQQDTFGESGKPDQLLAKYQMTADDIAAAVKTVL